MIDFEHLMLFIQGLALGSIFTFIIFCWIESKFINKKVKHQSLDMYLDGWHRINNRWVYIVELSDGLYMNGIRIQ